MRTITKKSRLQRTTHNVSLLKTTPLLEIIFQLILLNNDANNQGYNHQQNNRLIKSEYIKYKKLE